MTKKVLIHSLIFSPDGVSTAYLYADIAKKLHDSGFEVVVLTTTPHYNVLQENLKRQPLKWKIWGVCKESDYEGIRVIHIPQKKFKSTILRLAGFCYWHFLALFIGISIKNIDIILSPSPPLTIGIIKLLIGKIKKCKVVYNVQEIYPDILNLKSGLTLAVLQKMEKMVYNRSDAVTTIDEVFYNSIVGRFENKSRLHIIPNFVDTCIYNPDNSDLTILDRGLFPDTDSKKILYAGNIGYAQDWETLVQLAIATRDDNVEYFVIGEGVMKDWLIKKKNELSLSKIHILPYQQRTLMPHILAYSDMQFIFMSPESDMQGFPSKVYTIMACSKPLIVCSGKGSPIVNFLDQYNCSFIVSNESPKIKADIIAEWLRTVSDKELYTLGMNGYNAIQKHFSSDIVTTQYVKLLESL